MSGGYRRSTPSARLPLDDQAPQSWQWNLGYLATFVTR